MAQFWTRTTPYTAGSRPSHPIIVFDMEQVVPKDVYRTNLTDQKFSTLVLVGRKLLGL